MKLGQRAQAPPRLQAMIGEVMKAFWLNESLTIKPETEEERAALESLQAALGRNDSELVNVNHGVERGPIRRLNDK